MKRNHRYSEMVLVGLLVFAAALSGCASLKDSVTRLAAKGDYVSALAELEKAGAGSTVGPKVSSADLEARSVYQAAVERRTASSVESAATVGKAREALLAAEEGSRLCSWSPSIEATAKQRRQIVSDVDALASDWASMGPNGRDIASVRTFLGRSAALQQQMNDSPASLSAVNQARAAVVDFWASEIAPAMLRNADADVQIFDADLAVSGMPATSRATLSAGFKKLRSLPWSAEDAQALTSQQVALIRDVVPLASPPSQPATQDAGSMRLAAGLGSTFLTWRDSRFSKILTTATPGADVVDVAEQCLGLGNESSTGFRRALATAHLQYGERHASSGRAAVLAMLHAARARELEHSLAGQAEVLERTAGASITSAAPLEATIAVDLAPGVPPAIHDVVEMVVIGTITDRTRPGFKWRWVDPVTGSPMVRVRLDDARSLAVTRADLHLRESRYLSHYEDVPNPEKDRLSRAVDFARINMNVAESSYHSAVSSHNIYPTQWSLTAANSAYTRYSMAVDQYNLFVNSYNLTPSTISQPVYLPYAFQEGNVAQGWTFRGKAELDEFHTELAVEAVERDFVRIGSKFGDVNEGSRRDDSLDLNTGIDHRIALLLDAGEKLADQLTPLLSKLPTTPRAGLADGEQATVGWLLHPFGGTEKVGRDGGIAAWALATGGRLAVPVTPVRPPETTLGDPPVFGLGATPTPEQVASAFAPFACQITIGSASGSGALVSGDGLVLTCAHVLVGPAARVRFADGPAKGEYDTEVVFVNELADVALIRAVGLRTDRWLPIRLDRPCDKGEPIVAFGNPAVPGVTGASDTMTSGMVANPEAPAFGSKRLVADIAVASGSSGGPLVATRTGEIVGVVQLVVAPGVSDFGGTSASGYFAMAAPAHLLPELLGLKRLPAPAP